MFNAIELIEKKRDGGEHLKCEMQALVDAVMKNEIQDYQLSSWLMAAYLKGLNDDEIMHLTEALANSGDMLHPPEEYKIIDKHSTGGVGDKTTLVLVPLVAACGAKVSKLSGPGLGYTGGTVDKLESIPGMELHLNSEKFREQVHSIGGAISGHSLKLAPAEAKFYMMRSVSGTIPSIALIVTSIISKKLAGGAYGFIFDVKCGSGAFMPNSKDATLLAEKLVLISKKLGKKCIAIITDMEQPLGEWVGNAAEVYEAIEVLSGKGPSDTRELCLTLGGYMLTMAGLSNSPEEGFNMCRIALDDGRALKKFGELIDAQGGNPAVVNDPLKILPAAKYIYDVKINSSGYLSRVDARSIGQALRALGGGRMKYGDIIDPSVSIQICAKVGDKVGTGDAVLRIYYNSEEQLENAMPYLSSCCAVSKNAEKRKLIIGTVG